MKFVKWIWIPTIILLIVVVILFFNTLKLSKENERLSYIHGYLSGKNDMLDCLNENPAADTLTITMCIEKKYCANKYVDDPESCDQLQVILPDGRIQSIVERRSNNGIRT